MRAKIFTLFLLTAILLTTLVSALNFAVSQPAKLTKALDSTELIITNNEAFDIDVTVTLPSSITDSVDTVTLTPSGTQAVFSLDAAGGTNDKKTITVTRDAIPSDFTLGEFDSDVITVYAEEKGTSSNNDTIDTRKISLVNSYCENGVQGTELDLDVDIKNDIGYGEEDNEWYPLDQIEVKATVDNVGNVDVDDIYLEWCLYNPGKRKCTDIEDKESKFKLKEDKDKEVLINFEVNPNDIDEKNDDYVFYIKAYSKDKDFGEDLLCTEYSEDISIMRDSHFVILKDLVFTDPVPCGETLDVTADVWNIGDDDEADVYITVFNKELGINERVDIGNIDALENEKFTFNFKVPDDAAEKRYFLQFEVYDEYDDLFENDNSDESRFTGSFTVEGNCKVEAPERGASITAELESDAVAGEKLVIKGTIKNTGQEETTYSLSVTGYSSWAELDKVEPITITLDKGTSKDFKIYLNVNEDADGEQFFTIRADYDTESTEQDVSVVIEGKPEVTGAITGAVIGEHLRENWFIWVIIIINIILIIAIIAVARRIATSR